MKNIVLFISTFFVSNYVISQTWQSVNFSGGMVYNVDTFNNKLYLSTGGLVSEYDGNSWNNIINYNNSLNTPNKSKYCVKNIDNQLYMGAKDFNTSKEGIIHVYNGDTVIEKQGFRQFAYNGSRKVIGFTKANNTIYMATNDSLFYWDNGMQKWNTINSHAINEIKLIQTFKNKLVVLTNSDFYFFDGNNWDSLGLGNLTPTDGQFLFSKINDLSILNDTIYAIGTINKIITVTPQHVIKGNILKIYENGYSISDVSFSGYGQFGNNKTFLGRVFVDPSTNEMYVTCIKDDSIGDIYLYKQSATGWNELSLLVKKGEGYIPSVPGSELADYNIIFAYNNNIFVGGRFNKIDGNSIQSLAKFVGSSTALKEKTKANNSIVFYPNPAHNTLKFSNQVEKLSIYDLIGNFYNLPLINNSVDLSNLKSGIYFITAELNGIEIKSKFIKD